MKPEVMPTKPVVIECQFMSLSQAGVHLINTLPNYIRNAPKPKAFKIRLERFFVVKVFYDISEFLAYDWEGTILHHQRRGRG